LSQIERLVLPLHRKPFVATGLKDRVMFFRFSKSKIFTAAVIASSVFTYSAREAQAQDFAAMIELEKQKMNAMNVQMQQMQNSIVSQNMQNPQVQQMYQQYRAQGGMESMEQFAYRYAATGGMTPEGTAFYYNNERAIQANDAAAVAAYRNNQMQNQAALTQQRQNSADWQARANGNILAGRSDYVDPSTGTVYNLQNTQPNTVNYNYGSGQQLYQDPAGNYYRGDQNGNWYEMEEAD
jgi:hypothetical protein